ncbi:hypothetical protein HK101_003916 [Irineochytrium annulatum]|nr:hypothetical protein HK101_003916 [Irineochytrium annulatum]
MPKRPCARSSNENNGAADDDAVDTAARLNGDVHRLILNSLDPDEHLDRATLLTCLRASSAFFHLSATILWSTQAEVSTKHGVRRRIDPGTSIDAKGTLSALSELRRSTKGGRNIGGRAWRWKIYLSVVRTLRIETDHHPTNPHVIPTASLSPWVGKVFELVVDFRCDFGKWMEWLRVRWSDNEVPTVLTLIQPALGIDEAASISSHKGIKELNLSLVLCGSLQAIVSEIRHELEAIRVRGFFNSKDATASLKTLANYARMRGSKLRAVELTAFWRQLVIPEGLPVTAVHMAENYSNLYRDRQSLCGSIAKDFAAVSESLQILHLDRFYCYPTSAEEIFQVIKEAAALRELSMFLVIENAAQPNFLQNKACLRKLELEFRELSVGVLGLQDHALFLPGLTSLSIRAGNSSTSYSSKAIDVGALVSALPALNILHLSVYNSRGESYISLPRKLRKLVLHQLPLKVDRALVEAHGLPLLEYISITGEIVDTSGHSYHKVFMNLLGEKSCAPRLCYKEFNLDKRLSWRVKERRLLEGMTRRNCLSTS